HTLVPSQQDQCFSLAILLLKLVSVGYKRIGAVALCIGLRQARGFRREYIALLWNLHLPCLAAAELLDQLPDFRASEPTPHQKCDQPAFSHRRGRRWLLKQATPQVEARMRPARDCAHRRAMGSLEIGKLLESLEDERSDLRSQDEIQSGKIGGRQRGKTPPIHFDQPIVRPAW